MSDEKNNTQSAVEAGLAQAKIADRICNIVTDAGTMPLVLLQGEDGQQSVELQTDVLDAVWKYANAPRRIRGTAQHQEIESFIAHVNRFKDGDSVIWADAEKNTLTAVLNYHGGAPAAADGSYAARAASPRWSDHRAFYACPLSPQWKRWIGLNEKWMSQADFAALIEDNLTDLTGPNVDEPDHGDYSMPATVVQAIRTLAIHSSTKFKSEINRDTGATSLVFDLDHDQKDVAKVPRGFVLAIPIYLGDVYYRVKARVRFRTKDSQAAFQYAIQNPDVLLRDAFSAIRKQTQEGTGLPLFVGSPE